MWKHEHKPAPWSQGALVPGAATQSSIATASAAKATGTEAEIEEVALQRVTGVLAELQAKANVYGPLQAATQASAMARALARLVPALEDQAEVLGGLACSASHLAVPFHTIVGAYKQRAEKESEVRWHREGQAGSAKHRDTYPAGYHQCGRCFQVLPVEYYAYGEEEEGDAEVARGALRRCSDCQGQAPMFAPGLAQCSFCLGVLCADQFSPKQLRKHYEGFCDECISHGAFDWLHEYIDDGEALKAKAETEAKAEAAAASTSARARMPAPRASPAPRAPPAGPASRIESKWPAGNLYQCSSCLYAMGWHHFSEAQLDKHDYRCCEDCVDSGWYTFEAPWPPGMTLCDSCTETLHVSEFPRIEQRKGREHMCNSCLQEQRDMAADEAEEAERARAFAADAEEEQRASARDAFRAKVKAFERNEAETRRAAVSAEASPAAAQVAAQAHSCHSCLGRFASTAFSFSQLRKPNPRCAQCVEKSLQRPTHQCSACLQALPQNMFSRSQWSKQPAGRCSPCVTLSLP